MNLIYSFSFQVYNTHCGSAVKNLPAKAGDVGSIPGLGISPGGHIQGNGNPFQNSCLRNPMDRGAWLAAVHEVSKNWI